jgi:hypothetical protein
MSAPIGIGVGISAGGGVSLNRRSRLPHGGAPHLRRSTDGLGIHDIKRRWHEMSVWLQLWIK